LRGSDRALLRQQRGLLLAGQQVGLVLLVRRVQRIVASSLSLLERRLGTRIASALDHAVLLDRSKRAFRHDARLNTLREGLRVLELHRRPVLLVLLLQRRERVVDIARVGAERGRDQQLVDAVQRRLQQLVLPRLDHRQVVALFAVAGRLQALGRLAEQPRHRDIGGTGDDQQERVHHRGNAGPIHLQLLPVVLHVEHGRAPRRLALAEGTETSGDLRLAFTRADDAHQVLELDHVARSPVDQRGEARLRQVGIAHRIADRLHDRVAPKPRERREEPALWRLLTDERHHARRVDFHVVAAWLALIE
jgi:hypothetical protein